MDNRLIELHWKVTQRTLKRITERKEDALALIDNMEAYWAELRQTCTDHAPCTECHRGLKGNGWEL